MNNKIELLAPAGNPEKLKFAVKYGADAVYMAGKQFGLRAFSKNFTLKEMKEGVEFAGANGVKAFVTLNVFGFPRDFPKIDDYLEKLGEVNPDALIVSDAGIFSRVREVLPDMEIHLSTQANITNAAACEFWYKAGAKRIILSRELSLEDIKKIRRDISPEIELEAFVHGAMCVAYSGRCLMSATLLNRSANRGECAQPCRWKFEITEEKHPDQPLIMEEDERGTYLLNSRDLCMVEHIPDLIEAGLSSLKIEGRMRGVYYASSVTKAYREAIDFYYENGREKDLPAYILEDLHKTVHRQFDTGFFYPRKKGDAVISYDETYIREAKFAGIVRDYDPSEGRALIEQRNKIEEGDILEIISPVGRHFRMKAGGMQDEEGADISSTPHPCMLYTMPVDKELEPYSLIRLIEGE